MVMCRLPAMRAPASGLAAAYLRRMVIRPGISCSAMAISLRPQSARARLATTKSCWAAGLVLPTGGLVAKAVIGILLPRELRGGSHRKRTVMITIRAAAANGDRRRTHQQQDAQGSDLAGVDGKRYSSNSCSWARRLGATFRQAAASAGRTTGSVAGPRCT